MISKSSKIFTKKVDADNIENAKESLLKSGLKPVEISPDWVATILTRFTKRRLSRKEHIAFFEDFISFIKIGLSIEEILNQIEDTSLSKNVKNVSQKMVDMIHKGYHLSQAMDETGMFSDLAAKTIKLGEVSPSIEPVMNDLVAHYQKEDTFYSGMRAVMIYPTILIIIIASAFFFLCFWVLP
ncbi:MAG: type II secretion system F family protein, partial [Candidatus Omnitrophica bacterium]|nr:type II secretion system F family protein [Candidatus Omnitrophota bacterium]